MAQDFRLLCGHVPIPRVFWGAYPSDYVEDVTWDINKVWSRPQTFIDTGGPGCVTYMLASHSSQKASDGSDLHRSELTEDLLAIGNKFPHRQRIPKMERFTSPLANPMYSSSWRAGGD